MGLLQDNQSIPYITMTSWWARWRLTSRTIVYSTIFSGTDQRKHQSSASLAFVRGIRRWPVNSPHKGPVTRKMFLFDNVIMLPCCPVLPGHEQPWKYLLKAHGFLFSADKDPTLSSISVLKDDRNCKYIWRYLIIIQHKKQCFLLSLQS